MNDQFSHEKDFEAILTKIIHSSDLHAKWLNTLSYLENCGARKIAACENPTHVKEEMLKHAAEEFRHAHYLKRQIKRVSNAALTNYSLKNILGGTASLHYLNALDLQTSRYLSLYLPSKMKGASYLLVTYAIELRAGQLYPLYDQLLRGNQSKVTVKSIILEEEEHLKEMEEGLNQLPSGFTHAQYICSIEQKLWKKWVSALSREITTIH